MTKNLKRTTIILSIIFFVFSLFGCGKKGISNTPNTSNQSKITKNNLEIKNNQISSKNDKPENLKKPTSLAKDVKKVAENTTKAKIVSQTNKNINSKDLSIKTTKVKTNVVRKALNYSNNSNKSIVKVKNNSIPSAQIKQQVKPQVKPEPQTEVNSKVVETNNKTNSNIDNNKNIIDTQIPNTNNLGILKVHYINVGQADSILVEQDKHFMLIDAGNNDDDKLVVEYLQKQGVKKLDYIIGTHPHEDHIGGLDKVIDSFHVETLLMSNKVTNTKTFKDVLTSAQKKNLKITQPTVGTNYNLGKATFTILAPKNKEYKSTNNYSIVQKLKFGNTSFIFTGDAEAISEMEMVNANLNLQADVLKTGHHGSKTSTCQAFLDKVNPKYAIISCGKDNKYHHPNQSTMNRLKTKNIKVYRTDESGTVVATSNGKDIKFNCKEGSYNFRDHSTINTNNKATTSVVKDKINDKDKSHNQIVDQKPTKKPQNSNKDTSKKSNVYYTNNGSCYHSSKKCYTLKRSKKIITGTVKNCGRRRPCNKCYNN